MLYEPTYPLLRSSHMLRHRWVGGALRPNGWERTPIQAIAKLSNEPEWAIALPLTLGLTTGTGGLAD